MGSLTSLVTKKSTGAKKSQKGRKIGRNKTKCQRYRLESRAEKSSARRLTRHLKDQLERGVGPDLVAKEALERVKLFVRRK